MLSELTEDPTYVNPTYPRFVVLKTINIIGTAAFCPSWAKIRLTRVRLMRGLLYIYKITSGIFFINCTWAFRRLALLNDNNVDLEVYPLHYFFFIFTMNGGYTSVCCYWYHLYWQQIYI